MIGEEGTGPERKGHFTDIPKVQSVKRKVLEIASSTIRGDETRIRTGVPTIRIVPCNAWATLQRAFNGPNRYTYSTANF